MRASHILLEYRMKWPPSKQSHPRSREEAQLVIEGLLGRVLDGEAFSDLARTYSECPSSADGGDLGRFSFDQMAKAFSEVAFELEVGQVSPPVHTEFGVHLILRTE
ncbi:MAG: peptidylprolyl isomerase [Deltaproteobacteria bacterium]|nr:peptidylprolyl isomerase [Deltaproteobacteria bacterium]